MTIQASNSALLEIDTKIHSALKQFENIGKDLKRVSVLQQQLIEDSKGRKLGSVLAQTEKSTQAIVLTETDLNEINNLSKPIADLFGKEAGDYNTKILKEQRLAGYTNPNNLITNIISDPDIQQSSQNTSIHHKDRPLGGYITVNYNAKRNKVLSTAIAYHHTDAKTNLAPSQITPQLVRAILPKKIAAKMDKDSLAKQVLLLQRDLIQANGIKID